MRSSLTVAPGLLLLVASFANAQKPECSIRPPRGASRDELLRLVKVSARDAEAKAVAAVAPDKVASIMSSEVEVVNGCLAWPLDLRFANKGGVQEVIVDAGDGKILSSEYEPPAGGSAAGAASPPPEGTPSALPPGAVPPSDAVAAAEEPLIRKVIDAEEDAWNRGDVKALAARFQEEGSFTDIFGAVSRGRKELESRHAALFASYFKGSLLALKVRRVRFLRPDVAIVDIDTEITRFHKPPPAIYVDAEKVIRTRLVQVMVKAGNEWVVASFHDVDVKTPPETLVAPEEVRSRRR